MSQSPRIDRPKVPTGYGLEKADGYLDWGQVEDRLISSRNYWLSSTRPNGNAHVVPRWGVWLDTAFWYDGSPDTRHARNVDVNPFCVIHLESGDEVIIVEGPSLAPDPITGELGRRLAEEYSRKYGPEYTPEPDAWSGEGSGGMRVIRPEKVIAWCSFPSDLTRFTFST